MQNACGLTLCETVTL